MQFGDGAADEIPLVRPGKHQRRRPLDCCQLTHERQACLAGMLGARLSGVGDDDRPGPSCAVQRLSRGKTCGETLDRGGLENVERFALRDPWMSVDEPDFTDPVAEREPLRDRATERTTPDHRNEAHERYSTGMSPQPAPHPVRAALVTGGSRGIGFAIARALGASGASVAITGRDGGALETARKELGAGALTLRADVRNEREAAQAVDDTVRQFGGLDLLVNNAGVGLFAPVADMTPADWRQVIETNLSGVFYCCHAAIHHLRARGRGWIINISSLASKNAFVNGAAYCASKSGLNAFSEALMQEVRHDNIRVSCVMPGSVATGFGGRGPQGIAEWKLSPDDVAQVVMDLVAFPDRSLPSRVELRPSRPPK